MGNAIERKNAQEMRVNVTRFVSQKMREDA